MTRVVGSKIKALRELLGESQEEFGERFDVQQATVSRWEAGLPVARRYREAIASLAKMTVSEFFYTDQTVRLVPVAGSIEGRDGVTLSGSAGAGGAIAHIELGLGDKDQIGLHVVGDDWFPAYRDGDSIIARKVEGSQMDNYIGRDCIIKITNGPAYIRILKSGSTRGLYTLRSLNPAEDDIEDAYLEWVAPIVWIKRGD